MPKASRRLSLAVGEAGANKQRKSESEAAMPKASREIALSSNVLLENRSSTVARRRAMLSLREPKALERAGCGQRRWERSGNAAGIASSSPVVAPTARAGWRSCESEAAKGGCEGTNPLSETMQECMQKIFYFFIGNDTDVGAERAWLFRRDCNLCQLLYCCLIFFILKKRFRVLIQSNTPRRSSAREYHSIYCLSVRCTRVRPAYLLSSNYRTVAASPSVISRVSCCPVSQAQVNHFSFRHDML